MSDEKLKSQDNGKMKKTENFKNCKILDNNKKTFIFSIILIVGVIAIYLVISNCITKYINSIWCKLGIVLILSIITLFAITKILIKKQVFNANDYNQMIDLIEITDDITDITSFTLLFIGIEQSIFDIRKEFLMATITLKILSLGFKFIIKSKNNNYSRDNL